MYSILQEIDKYIKENDIPFKVISFNKSYLPTYINMAIIQEMKKSSSLPYIKINPEYELRRDKNDELYILVRSDRNRELFVIGSKLKKVEEDFKFSGRSENHIIKWGCLFKLLKDDIVNAEKLINSNYKYLSPREISRLKYEIVDELLEDKYQEFVKNNQFIENVVDYEDNIIESTFTLKDYIRYLFNYYNENIKIKKRVF